jgi:hypothetical protein
MDCIHIYIISFASWTGPALEIVYVCTVLAIILIIVKFNLKFCSVSSVPDVCQITQITTPNGIKPNPPAPFKYTSQTQHIIYCHSIALQKKYKFLLLNNTDQSTTPKTWTNFVLVVPSAAVVQLVLEWPSFVVQ